MKHSEQPKPRTPVPPPHVTPVSQGGDTHKFRSVPIDLPTSIPTRCVWCGAYYLGEPLCDC